MKTFKNDPVSNPLIVSTIAPTYPSKDSTAKEYVMREATATSTLARAMQNISNTQNYPFCVSPKHFTGKGFMPEWYCGKAGLTDAKIKIITYEEYGNTLGDDFMGTKSLLIDGICYRIINPEFCQFMQEIEKHTGNGLTEQFLQDLKRGNIRIGLSLREYLISAGDGKNTPNIVKYKVFLKLWRN